MKTKSETALPVVVFPRLSSTLENLAEHLARFCEEFGIGRDANFAKRVAAIACVNGVLLAHHLPEAAGALEAMLVKESLPANDEAEEFEGMFLEFFRTGTDWIHSVQGILVVSWAASADNSVGLDAKTALRLQILHGIRAGLVVARTLPETSGEIQKLNEVLPVEHRFLSARLRAWHDHDWKPQAAPFIEFTAAHYTYVPIERRLICKSISEVLPIARAFDNPWNVSFWVQTGWAGGRSISQNYPDECKALCTETGNDNLQGCVLLYRRYVLGTSRTDGEVQIERATLQFIGELKDPALAQCYCTGREPRRLVRVVYDFAFWMGMISVHPIPVEES